MKKTITVIVFLTILFLIGSYASADADVISSIKISADDATMISNAVREIKSSETVSGLYLKDVTENDIAKGYYLSYVLNEDVADKYRKGAKIDELLYDRTVVIIPIAAGGFATFEKTAGSAAWDYAGGTSSGQFGFIVDVDEIAGILNDERLKDASLGRIIHTGRNYVSFLYVAVSGVDYLVPFCDDPDSRGYSFKCGQVYPAEELLDVLSPFSGIALEDNWENSGSSRETDTLKVWLVVAAAATVVCAAGTVFLIKKKKAALKKA